MNNKYNCIIILGPTASGKTKLAVEIAREKNLLAVKAGGEIISIDSRQVYKKLNIGTGKDLEEYGEIPYHLIDIVEPTEKYHVHAFAKDFYKIFSEIKERGNLPILCGGTGLYFDTLLKKNELIAVPIDEGLRKYAEDKTYEDLLNTLLHNTYFSRYKFDTSTKKRVVRALEILEYAQKNKNVPHVLYHDLKPLIIGVKTSLEQRRNNISKRLRSRITNGLIEEAQGLIRDGISHEQLQYFGLEYKFLSLYLLGKLTKEEMVTQLETAIHQYAKRQMTWWRKMEREGFKINWVEDFQEADSLIKNVE
jgi:tRNA dimethylallyltransferase